MIEILITWTAILIFAFGLGGGDLPLREIYYEKSFNRSNMGYIHCIGVASFECICGIF